MASTKPCDFLSELKATLSKLTAHDDHPETGENSASEQAAPLLATTPDLDSNQNHNQPLLRITPDLYNNQHHSQPTYRNVQIETDTGVDCGRSVLFGELSSVLEKRGQQQLNDEHTASRVVELESRLKPGKSIVYLGSGQRKDILGADGVTIIQRSGTAEPRCDTLVTPLPAEEVKSGNDAVVDERMMNETDLEVPGCSEDENNSITDVISTSSAIVSVEQVRSGI